MVRETNAWVPKRRSSFLTAARRAEDNGARHFSKTGGSNMTEQTCIEADLALEQLAAAVPRAIEVLQSALAAGGP
jgi:hypothetical protein